MLIMYVYGLNVRVSTRSAIAEGSYVMLYLLVEAHYATNNEHTLPQSEGWQYRKHSGFEHHELR